MELETISLVIEIYKTIKELVVMSVKRCNNIRANNVPAIRESSTSGVTGVS